MAIINKYYIIDYLQSRKDCGAIMDDLLLFTPEKKSHKGKWERFAKELTKEWSDDFS